MTDEDIRRQQADALLAHREARTKANNVKARVNDIGARVRAVGAALEQNPHEFLPQRVITNGKGRILTPLPASHVDPKSVKEFVNLDAIIALAQELADAEDAVSDAAENAARLGVPV